MISELRVITVAVSDLERSCAFYREVFDYAVHDTGEVAGSAVERLWRMPDGLTGRCAVVAPAGATTGLLRLVQFDTVGERIWGDYGRGQDYGYYALNVRVPTIQAAMRRLRAAGGRTRSEPTHWTVSVDLSAWDSLSRDPDEVVLDVFQLEPGPGSALDDYDGRCTELETVAVHVSDARASARFYAALGFRPLYDKVVEGMESFFGLPDGTALHNINMLMPGASTSGRMEIAQYVGHPGRSQRDRAVPPNVGILSASMRTDDLAATTALLHSIGAEAASDQVEVDLPPYGPASARTFFGPDGELLEFYQSVSR